LSRIFLFICFSALGVYVLLLLGWSSNSDMLYWWITSSCSIIAYDVVMGLI